MVAMGYAAGVAPFTGAWIEILHDDYLVVRIAESHPSRVRGLK